MVKAPHFIKPIVKNTCDGDTSSYQSNNRKYVDHQSNGDTLDSMIKIYMWIINLMVETPQIIRLMIESVWISQGMVETHIRLPIK